MKKGSKGIYARFFKRLLDILFAFFGLVFLAIPFIIIAILVRLKMGNPVFFKQVRIGKDNKEFLLYKFRSMTNERDENGIFLSDDIRLTKFGKFIRMTSIDELPSLLNILKGDMSIIGPRPLPKRYLPRFTDRQLKRHNLRPGLSCLSTATGRNLQSWEEQFDGDLWYVDNVSFLVDIKSVLMTLKILLSRKGATAVDGGSRGEFMGLAKIEELKNDSEGNFIKL